MTDSPGLFRITSLRDLPIRRKLTLVIMLTCGLGLILAGTLIGFYEWSSSRQAMSQDMSTLAQIIGDQSTAALAFSDPKAAGETLSALSDQSEVTAAAIYTPDGRLFASYLRPDQPAGTVPPGPSHPGAHFGHGHLEIYQPIQQRGEVVGTIFLRASLDGIKAQLESYVGIVACLILVLMIATLFFSAAAQRGISDPILDLARVSLMVSDEKDYSLRVPVKGKDEVGQLILTFNQMLTKIEESDGALRNANTTLLVEVAERKRAEAKVLEATERLEILTEASRVFAQVGLNYEAILNRAAREFVEALGDICVIRLWSEEGEWLDSLAIQDENPNALSFLRSVVTGGSRSARETGIGRRVYESGEALLVPVLGEASLDEALKREYGPVLTHFAVHSLLVVPMHIQRRNIGSLFLARYSLGWPSLTGDDLRLAQELADRAALAINSARLHEDLRNELAERERAQAELRESAGRYQFLADSMPQIVWAASPDGVTDYYNDRWFEFTGLSRDSALAQGWLDAIHPEDLTFATGSWQGACKSGDDYQAIHRLKRASDQTYRWHLCRAVPRRNEEGEIVQWLGTCTDIDDHKRAIEEISQLNNSLEGRVQERTRELELRSQQLESANAELEAFSYTVSHDLRAPVRAMVGFTHILLKDYSEQLPDQVQHYLRRVSRNAENMGQLVDDLLAFSRLGRQPLSKQKVSPTNLVKTILDEMAGDMEGRHVEVKIGDLPLCHADPALLKQVLVNLVANALKFSRERDPAQVEIGADCPNGVPVYFVKDNGVGFDIQYASKLFGVFQRLHSVKDYEGTGVGLAIVQRVVHRHGGRVWAESTIGQGATFYFTLEGETANHEI